MLIFRLFFFIRLTNLRRQLSLIGCLGQNPPTIELKKLRDSLLLDLEKAQYRFEDHAKQVLFEEGQLFNAIAFCSAMFRWIESGGDLACVPAPNIQYDSVEVNYVVQYAVDIYTSIATHAENEIRAQRLEEFIKAFEDVSLTVDLPHYQSMVSSIIVPRYEKCDPVDANERILARLHDLHDGLRERIEFVFQESMRVHAVVIKGLAIIEHA